MSETSTFDINGVLQTQLDVLDAGGELLKFYDTRNTHPYSELDITTDPNRKVTGAQVKVDGQNGATADFSAVGQVLGSALGRALAPNNQFVALVAGTVVGAVGQKLAQAFAASLTTNAAGFNLASVFADFNISIASAGASSIASFLVAELGTALHFEGFSGQLFNAAAGGFAGSVASQIATKMAGTAGVAGVSFDAAIAGIQWTSAASSAAYGVSSLFGTFLANELAPAQTHQGAVGGQLLGAVGSAVGITAALSGALGTVLGFIAPGIGSLIGTILGTLISDAFGNVPHPAAVDLLDQHGYLYAATHYQVSASDGGDYSTPDQLAVPALAIINAYLGAVKGAAFDHSKQVTLGYQANPVFYIDGVPGHPAIGTYLYPNAAVQAAALDVLQNTEVIGGDLLLKRAHQNSTSNHPLAAPAPDPTSQNGDPGATGTATLVSAAEQLAVMSGDLALAQDYENYLNNREAINALMAANPDSAFTAGWIATFARVNELGLNQGAASDFLGGLVGYLDSVAKAGLGAVAANASVSHGGFQNSVITVAIKVPNGAEVPGSLVAFADATGVSSDATGQTVQLQFNGNLSAGGFRQLAPGAAGGDNVNDLWFGGDGGQTFNGTGGHDILAGGAGNDIIRGGPGWDFVQGGAGNDSLFGDDGNDILRGGPGNDALDGGSGTDTAVYSAAFASYSLISYNGHVAVLTHGADGVDRLQGIETIQFTDRTLTPAAAAAFDAWEYLASNVDLISGSTVNLQAAFDHYVNNGFNEGRAAASFDPIEYLASNPDLIAAGFTAASALQHFVSNGYSEHRATTSFDALEYLASNPDLIQAGYTPASATQQFVSSGFFAHRPTTSFDAAQYLVNNPDLAALFGSNNLAAARQHYITAGLGEGRTDNHAPVMTVASANVSASAGQTLQVTSLFSATDADMDTLSYNFYDNTAAANSGHFAVNGTAVAANTAFSVSAAQLAQVTFVAGAAGTSDDLTVWASDGKALSNLSGFHVNVPANHAPVVTVASANVSASAGQTLQVTGLFSATDADMDTLSYSFYDNTAAANSGHFSVNGTVVAANTAFSVSAAQLAQVTFVAGAAGASDDLTVWASDSKDISNLSGFHVNVPANHAPVVSATDTSASAGQTLQAASLFSATDADMDTLVYNFYDNTAAANSGHFAVNGTAVAANTAFSVSAAQLAQVTFVAGAAGTSDQLTVWASDGKDISNLSGFHVNVPANHAPVVSAADTSASAGQSLQVTSLFSATDADMDTLSYNFYDNTAAANSGHFAVNGTAVAANTAFTVGAAQLAQTTFVAGAAGTSDDLTVWASDGKAISNLSGFHVNVPANHAPVVTVASAGVSASAGQTLQATSLFSATDADMDTLSYNFYDNTAAANSGHFAVNGTAVPANTAFTVSAAQLAQTTFVAGASGASDDLIVWASDGKVISNFGEFHVYDL